MVAMWEKQKPQAMKSSIIIIGFFIAGILIGRIHAMPLTLDANELSLAILYALIFFVGVSIGSDNSVLSQVRSLSPRIALLPAMSLLGTMAGSVVVAFAIGKHSIAEWLAIGSGMGYYSLSSVIITEYHGAELGAIALLSNITREIITLIGTPLLYRIFGKLAPIAAGGATAMDTTLPIISRTCGAQYAPVSIYCGMATDFSVPFLVTLFCSIAT